MALEAAQEDRMDAEAVADKMLGGLCNRVISRNELIKALLAARDEGVDFAARQHAKLRQETWFMDGYKKGQIEGLEESKKLCGTCLYAWTEKGNKHKTDGHLCPHLQRAFDNGLEEAAKVSEYSQYINEGLRIANLIHALKGRQE